MKPDDGSIHDEYFGYPIEGVHVTVGADTKGTDQSGVAIFWDLALGEYEIHIKAFGYFPYHTAIQLSTPGTVNVRYNLEQICVGDFDKDGDVDAFDLGIFVADLGMTDCPCFQQKANAIDTLKEEIERLKVELAVKKAELAKK